VTVRIQKKDFDFAEELDSLADKKLNSGSYVSFLGTVRKKNQGLNVKSLKIEYYPLMTEKQLRSIENKANEMWPINSSLIIHRFGKMYPGENIVLVITTSTFREAAFKATEFIVEELKTKATFWKFEETSKKSYWLDPDQTRQV